MGKQVRALIAVVTVALLLAGCKSYEYHGTVYDPAKAASPISGVNWDGANFNLSQLQGKPVLLFFGYTNCPDVCPTTLAEWRVLRQNLGAKADKAGFVYVSVDPDRDTVARLKEFIPMFDPAFFGVHVDNPTLETVETGYGVYAQKVFTDPNNPAAGYSVDHTARTYLISPDAKLTVTYPYQTDVADLQKDLEHMMR